MTVVGEFPSNCSTNTIILQDFGEVAYIVCTVSIPPQGNNASQSSTPESNLARLKHTEQQFRQASILASIDSEALQLFTFYKKVDVLKDQRSILTKFGQILRTNSCTISYKAATRAPELFKAEGGRLYRLFVSAILSSIEFDTGDDRQLVPLGPRYLAIQMVDRPGNFTQQAVEQWSLLRTDLQMVPSGQIVVTISEQRYLTPLASTDNQPQRVSNSQSTVRPVPVVLAPTGQLAVYRNGWIGQINQTGTRPDGLSSRLFAILRIWQNLFAEWAEGNSLVLTESDDLWVELAIPVQEQVPSELPESPLTAKKPESRPSMAFKTLFWPAQRCFIFDTVDESFGDKATESDYDPVQFILEWFESMSGGDFGLTNSKDRHDSADNDDVSVFPDDNAFDNAETFQPFGPPTFPASQTVYPTPPDAVMTHATPAMSSVDGLAATPATMSRNPGDVNTNRPDTSTDLDSTIAVGVGSGLYDEDLFDDMPGDNFGQETAGDEPNWDFFDKPTNEAEPADPESTNLEVNDPMDVDSSTVPADGPISETKNEHDREIGHDCQSATIPTDRMSPVEGTSAPDTDGLPHEMEFDDNDGMEAMPAAANSLAARRRSSAFDGVRRPVASPKRDQRYTASGNFYFNAQAAHKKPAQSPRDLTQWIRRSSSPSASSDSDHSGYETPIDPDSPLEFKVQTPGQLPEDATYLPADLDVQVDMKGLEQDAQNLFELVRMPHTRATLDEAVVPGRPTGLGSQFDKPSVRNGFAHEIVHQITQTCLLQDLYGTSTLKTDGSSQNDVSLTVGTLAEGVTYSTVSHLCSFVSPANGKPPPGRTMRLLTPEVTMKRLDKQITAHPTILPFWDVLGLQPYPKPKDVTAFCLHPHGAGMAENCLDFLDRIADSYVSCNLGQHSTGHISGVTSNGLLEADPTDQGMYLGPVRRLGEALAKPTQKGGTLVIYLIASSQQDMAFVYCSVASYAIRRHVEQGWAKRSEQLNLVFQVIPPSFVASPQEVVVPSQSKYNTLAMGVYSRIPPFDNETSLGICEYPLVLPEGRDGVSFDLDASTISPLSRQGACLHLCYSFSEDRRWLVAAWTDERGYLSFSLPYQVKAHTLGPARPIDDIIKDMWSVSQDLMAKQRYKWRLVASRVGAIEAPEANAWMSVSNSQPTNGTTRCSLFLLSVELNPTLRVFPQSDHPKAAQNAYSTPTSNPPDVTSPEQVVAATPTPGGSAFNAPTPPDQFDHNAENDLSIIDPSEESWAVVLPYGQNMSREIMEMRPAIASGYLVTRIGTKEEDGVRILGMHLVFPSPDPAATSQGQREEELTEFMGHFRGLATLAAARGLSVTVPWHIHTAVSGARALGNLI